LVKKADKLGDRVRNRVDFFSEIGAGFVVRRAGKRASAVRPTRASGPASPRLRRDASQLIPLNEEVLVCRKCPLGKIRLHAVPGEGGIDSGLMFVGEAPGAEENAQGRPFVGRAGQLLTKIIAAMGYERSEVYITNIIKCQPPGNRTPLADEVDACTPYLQRQIAIIQPRAIVALGSVAAGFFVPGGMKISSLRGTFFDYHAVKVMPTYHPSYLVRNQGNRKLKRDVWNDMQKVMALLAKK
jgi:uracil-DNA glycosylase family 4